MTDRPAPRSDDHTYAVVDHALLELATRRVDWLGDELTVISLITSVVDQLERSLPELFTTARLNGVSWQDSAEMLVTSPDEARLRSDPESPVADARWPLRHRVTTTPLPAPNHRQADRGWME